MAARDAHKIAILNRSSVVSDDDVRKMVSALQIACTRDFSKYWGIDAKLSFVPKGDTSGWQGKWNILLLDTSDEAGALGYHDLTPEGLALGKVFAKTDQQYGAKVSVTLAHELFEMMLDPYINLTAEDSNRHIFVAYEASDAVEADELGYEIDGVTISDFVLPDFFDPTAASREGARYSFRNNVKKPFELAPGGYESIYIPGQGWTQKTARDGGAHVGDRPKVGSRRERRMTPTAEWRRSAD